MRSIQECGISSLLAGTPLVFFLDVLLILNVCEQIIKHRTNLSGSQHKGYSKYPGMRYQQLAGTKTPGVFLGVLLMLCVCEQIIKHRMNLSGS